MPLILNDYESSYRLALWRPDEPLAYFEGKARFTPYDERIYQEINNTVRKKEWLAVRIMLNEVLGFWPNITYTETGKPLLNNHQRHLSISHSREMVGILLCTSPYAGIDIEKSDRNIDKVRHRFLSASEQEYLERNPEIRHKIIYWCAKEAIFKSVNAPHIEFSKQIQILDIKEDGTMKGLFVSPKETIHYDLFYREINEHIIVWTT
ncbi:MAG TPA: 4'-phosphopantetheinyl transferase superfamily protein [Prolixibacteraceae bacterium]|nr:4'-phosphopantetheinyl transferase superfamily protein [Prolixibacteraceae bacterium]